jgi:hypothetical protein
MDMNVGRHVSASLVPEERISAVSWVGGCERLNKPAGIWKREQKSVTAVEFEDFDANLMN